MLARKDFGNTKGHSRGHRNKRQPTSSKAQTEMMQLSQFQNDNLSTSGSADIHEASGVDTYQYSHELRGFDKIW